MNTFRCPHCGSPVMLRGNWWECGWCGDSGYFAPHKQPEQNNLPAICDGELEELERAVLSVVEGMQKRLGNGQPARTQALQLAVYGMSHALRPSGHQTPHSIALLQAFFRCYSFCTASEVLGAARSGTPAFADQFALEQERLGSFWRSVLADLPAYPLGRAWPDWLCQTLDGLSRIESCFSGRDASDEFAALQQIWNAHWNTYPILHPNRAKLEDMVRRWDLTENEWACRDLLIAAFPQAMDGWTAEALAEMETADLLTAVGEQNPETAVDMIKLLLDTVGDRLKEEQVAAQLLGMDMDGLFREPVAQKTLLQRLQTDDKLARQLFQSACVETGQQILYEACDDPALHEKLRILLQDNPRFAGFD